MEADRRGFVLASGRYIFPTCEGLVAKLGVYCYDGTAGMNPISLAIDLLIF